MGYVAKSVSVFLQELMGTSMSVLAIVTSSAAKRLPSVLDSTSLQPNFYINKNEKSREVII